MKITAPSAEDFDLQGSLEAVMPARYVPNGVVVDAELEVVRFLGDSSAYLRPAPGRSSLNLRRMAGGRFLLELRSAVRAAERSAAPVRKEIAVPHPSGEPRRAVLAVLPIRRSRAGGGCFLILFEELFASTAEAGRDNLILSRANNDLSNLLASIDIPVVLLDPDLNIHRFTPAAVSTLGLSPGKIGRSILDIKLPLRLSALKDLLLSVIKTGRVRTQEVQDTQGRWFYLILRPYRTDKSKTEKSRTEGAVMALVDIHERKLAEKTAQRLAAVVLDSNDAVFVADLEDRIIAWNKSAQTMYGYTEAQALGMSVLRLMPEETRVRARDLVRVSSAPLSARRRARDGRLLDVMTTVTVLRGDEGEPIEVAVTDRDVTELRRAERERKDSEKTVLRLVTSVIDSNDAVIICDLKDRILAWNKGARKMYGYTESQALKMSIARLMPENRRLKALDLVGRSEAPVEIQRRTKGGQILDVQLTVTVLRDDKGQPVEVATTERDITEVKLADRELRRLHASVVSAQETERKRLARELHDGVGQILSGVKFRLQALPGQMALSGGGEAKILKVGGFLDQAITEVRRVSQDLMPSELIDLGLGPALSTLCREFKERSGIHVTLRDTAGRVGLPPEVELALFRICQEGLNNIGKYSKATMVVVSLSHKGKELTLSVGDNGVGFKTGGPRQAAGKGFGLGNMRQRAEAVGGAFDLHSAPGAGTTLSVRMPLTGLGR